MTRRERLERKLEKRSEWAGKAEHRAASLFDTAHKSLQQIPPGQPILIGHHSEKHHRAHLARVDGQMSRGFEQSKLAEHHNSKAEGLAAQLEGSIYSDDPDAIEALEAKAASLKAEVETMKAANKAYRKAKGSTGWAAGLPNAEALETACARLMTICPYERQPYPSYKLSNTNAEIRRAEKRIETVRAMKNRTERAEKAGGIIITGSAEYVSITFADKPERSILNALREAGFRWGVGSWHGRRDAIPASVTALSHPTQEHAHE